MRPTLSSTCPMPVFTFLAAIVLDVGKRMLHKGSTSYLFDNFSKFEQNTDSSRVIVALETDTGELIEGLVHTNVAIFENVAFSYANCSLGH